MKPEDQQIAIAEWCGWEITKLDYEYTQPVGYTYVNGIKKINVIPNYPNDLNAMREAEFKLNDGQAMEYERNLRIICGEKQYRNVISAESSKRAEALLRTIGRWTDDQTK